MRIYMWNREIGNGGKLVGNIKDRLNVEMCEMRNGVTIKREGR